MPPLRRQLDPRDMKSAYVVSDENGYYDSQNIINVYDKFLGKQVLSCILHHSRNHEGGKGKKDYRILENAQYSTQNGTLGWVHTLNGHADLMM